MQFKATRLAAAGLAVVALLALFVAACSSDVEKEDIDTLSEQIAELEEQNSKGDILAWRTALRAEDLHGLQESLEEANEIDESWIGRATRSRQATSAVSWPDDMSAAGDELATTLGTLEGALADGDIAAATTAATDAHEQYHDLEHDASPYIAGETPAAHGDEGGEGASPEASGEAGH